MFNAQELWRFGCLDCGYCQFSDDSEQCCRKGRNCNFTPYDWNSFIQVVVNSLRLIVEPSTNKKLVRTNRYRPMNGIYDDAFTQDQFYVQIVNDSLYCLRHGFPAYVFSLYHIVDILKFEPNIRVRYIPEANSFCLTKPPDK